MKITEAEFIQSNTSFEKCPKADFPEYAFIGRSNVGKSSLINMLAGKKGMAKTSSTPGKTQLINHFFINKSFYIADLPGYGYAKVAKSSKEKWDKMIRDYLMKRENLMNVFVLIDSRLEPQKIDIAFIKWIGEKGIPFSIAFTKADKLTKAKALRNTQIFKNELLKTWVALPPLFITSSEEKTGKEEILNYISEVNRIFVHPQKMTF
jgi:GTP-binding protein